MPIHAEEEVQSFLALCNADIGWKGFQRPLRASRPCRRGRPLGTLLREIGIPPLVDAGACGAG